MLKKKSKGYWVLESLSKYPKLIHAVSSREMGNMNVQENPQNWPHAEAFLKLLGLERKNLVLMEQIHGSRIKKVGQEEGGKIIAGVDGLITSQPGVILGVKAADCLPLLFYEPRAGIIGAAHAGWQGMAKALPRKMIELMIKLGALPERILIGVGPAVCDACFYSPGPVVQEKLPEWRPYLKSSGKQIKIEINRFLKDRLTEMGILKKNLEWSRVCTSARKNDFYSHKAAQKKGQEEKEGRFLSLIGLK